MLNLKYSTSILLVIICFLIPSCNGLNFNDNSNSKRVKARKNLDQIIEIENLYQQWNKIYKTENVLSTVYPADSLYSQRSKICESIISFYNEYGFPNIEEIGEVNLNNFYLVATEYSSNGKFLEQYLDSLNKEFNSKNIESNTYANCIDRITFAKEGKQVYGTLIGMAERGIKLRVLVPLKDSANVNALRTKAKLITLENYIEEKNEKFSERFITYNES